MSGPADPQDPATALQEALEYELKLRQAVRDLDAAGEDDETERLVNVLELLVTAPDGALPDNWEDRLFDEPTPRRRRLNAGTGSDKP